jgi:branched-chain amino acid transport system permease protein
VLRFRGEYNPKTLRREKTIIDKRPIWWMLGFVALMLAPFVMPEGNRVLLSAAAVFSIYAAINLCWTLVIGTAGIYSLATFAVVGAGAYGAAYLSIHFGLPIPLMLLAGGLIGLVFGILIAIPAVRLEGFYYALLTLGVVELCRVYIIQSKAFGSEIGGLYGAATYIPEEWDEFAQLRLDTTPLRLYWCALCCFSVLLMENGWVASCVWRRKNERLLLRRPGSIIVLHAFRYF